MSDFVATLPSHFGLLGIRAVKERGYYLCKTEFGFYKIHKTHDNHQQIRLRHALLDQLEGLGFPWTDKIMLGTQGAPFVQLGRETYVMSRHIKGRDIDLDCLQDMILAIESLARFHMTARGVKFADELTPGTSAPLSATFAKNSAFLTKTTRQTSKNSRLSDFDVLFIKSSAQYINQAAESAQLLAQTNYHALHAAALAENHICHNILKEENLPILDDICHITNFSEATVDTQITDLASFLRRYARRSRREIPLVKLIEVYDRIFPLPQFATAIIYAQLVHPWQFVKIARQYYSKKRGWTPAAIMSRMTGLLEAQEHYDAYVSALL